MIDNKNYQKQYHQRTDIKIKTREYNRKYCQRPYIKTKRKEYRNKNKEYFKEKNKEWIKNNPEKWKAIQRKYRQKIPEKYSYRRYRNIIVNTLGNKCSICGSTERLEIHEKNGWNPKTVLNDCILVCRKCHRIKIHKYDI